eukprot:NODE_834_length_3613_cov_0.384178.p4 type:complete len:103 gc:universal NODE_834_length_3613_cov_0.384178:2723-2415(-)
MIPYLTTVFNVPLNIFLLNVPVALTLLGVFGLIMSSNCSTSILKEPLSEQDVIAANAKKSVKIMLLSIGIQRPFIWLIQVESLSSVVLLLGLYHSPFFSIAK